MPRYGSGFHIPFVPCSAAERNGHIHEEKRGLEPFATGKNQLGNLLDYTKPFNLCRPVSVLIPIIHNEIYSSSYSHTCDCFLYSVGEIPIRRWNTLLK